MIKSIKRIILLMFVLVLSISMISACKKKAEVSSGKITSSTNQTSVTDPSGLIGMNQAKLVKAMGLGWNLGNQLEAVMSQMPGETNWGNPVITEDLIKAVKAAGFQSIRIPVSYFKKIGEAPDYKIDPAWLDRIQEVVDYCVKNGLYTVINIHGDGYQSIDGGWLYCNAEDQKPIQDKFQAIWKQIATRFKDYDDHLIFESMNEISDMSYSGPKKEMYDNLNTYNRIFLDTIRQTGGNNDKRWVQMPGWNTDITFTAGDYGFVIPEDRYLSDQIPNGESRIMISVHYYSPWDFCGGESGQITQWGDDAKDSTKASTYSGQSVMAKQFRLLNERFVSKGYPVIISEFGAIDKSEDDKDNPYYREQFDRKVCENSLKYGCIPICWDNGYNAKYGFALFDRTTCKVTQQGIIDAMMSVYYPVKEKGTSTGITLDQSSLVFQLGDNPVPLTASLVPTASKDTIHWSSSDETIATVSSKGVVTAQSTGTAIITAVANGNKANCSVVVKEATDVKLKLYAIETSTWSTIQSDDVATVNKNGGTYTLTLTGSKDMLSKIGSLFIKDVAVQVEDKTTSLYTQAQIKINSIKFNGKKYKCLIDGTEDAVNHSTKAFDYCLLNQWVPDSEISGAKLGDSGSYYFKNADYKDFNTIKITFTVSDIVSE